MVYKYLVIKHDYKLKCTNVEYECDSLHNAAEYTHDICYNFIVEKMGRKFKIHDYHRNISSYWKPFKYGYYLIKNTSESIYKMKIIQKRKINGLLYDSYVIDNLFYYEIVRKYENIDVSEAVYRLYKESSDEEVIYADLSMSKVINELLDKYDDIRKKFVLCEEYPIKQDN